MFVLSAKSPNKPAQMGMNLADHTYYSTELAFQNLALMLQPTWTPVLNGNWNTGSAITYTADGYPNNVGSGLVAANVLQLNNSLPNGTALTITWSGPATGVTVDGATNGNNTASYTRTSAVNTNLLIRINANGVTNLVIRKTSETITGKFRQAFLDRCKRYSCIRFMNWGQTNSPTAVTWAGRKTESHLSQGDLTKGVAFEHMIDLCNETGCAGWFCIHHTADDTYVSSLASLIGSRRTGNWPIYVEYSNEIWNDIFTAKAYLNSISGGNWFPQQITRTQQIGLLMRASVPITLVLGMHSTNVNFGQWYLVEQPSPYNLDGIDAIAIAPYFGNEAHMEPTLSTITSMQAAIDACDDHLDVGITEQMQGWKMICDARRKRLIGYEGGPHLQMFANTTVTGYFASANRNTQMYDLTLKYLRLWKTLTGGDLLCYFNSIYYDTIYDFNTSSNKDNESGTWGAMTFEGQTVNSTTNNAVKQAAIVDFMAETKQ